MADRCVLKCPACGQDAAAEVDDNGDTSVMHVLPMCERFKRIETTDDASEWLKDARLKRMN